LFSGKKKGGDQMKILIARLFQFRCFLGFAIGSIVFGGTIPPSFAATTDPGHIALRDEKLTVRIIATPIRQVLEQVGQLTGARILWLGQKEEGSVSVEFTDLPFSDALRRLLGERNFLLFYTSSGTETKLSEIWILSPSVEGGQTPSIVPAPTPPQIPSQALQTALYGQDRSARLTAVRRLKRFGQTDLRVKSILSQLIQSDPEPAVRKAAEKTLAEMQ
jgi:hypothetical protein